MMAGDGLPVAMFKLSGRMSILTLDISPKVQLFIPFKCSKISFTQAGLNLFEREKK